MSHFSVLVIGPRDKLEAQLNSYTEKWDWYWIGGRWTGFFKLKDGAEGEVGSKGFMTTAAEEGYVDRARKDDIDFDSMRAHNVVEAERRYDIYTAYMRDTPDAEHWDALRTRVMEVGETETTNDEELTGINLARHLYHDQPKVKAFNELCKTHPDDFSLWWEGFEAYDKTKEEYLQAALDATAVTSAVVKDDVWYEKGIMGGNEQNQNEWNRQFAKLIDEVPGYTTFTLVDCRI